MNHLQINKQMQQQWIHYGIFKKDSVIDRPLEYGPMFFFDVELVFGLGVISENCDARKRHRHRKIDML